MAPHWTSRLTHTAREMGRVFWTTQWQSHDEDADARRMRTDLDAMRTRFPDHS